MIGGGNSAFTAARDLLPLARDTHVVHLLETFQPDPVLVAPVKTNKRVTLYMSSEVKELLGTVRLTGIRVQPTNGAEAYDLAVEGVFLEIGLVPNSQPVLALVRLNEGGEIPVARAQSTAVSGLFAVGDATDTPDKQIVIAAGQGAQAALSAQRYLMQTRAEPSKDARPAKIEPVMAGPAV